MNIMLLIIKSELTLSSENDFVLMLLMATGAMALSAILIYFSVVFLIDSIRYVTLSRFTVKGTKSSLPNYEVQLEGVMESETSGKLMTNRTSRPQSIKKFEPNALKENPDEPVEPETDNTPLFKPLDKN